MWGIAAFVIAATAAGSGDIRLWVYRVAAALGLPGQTSHRASSAQPRAAWSSLLTKRVAASSERSPP
jgi:hypothetical protein